MYIKNRKRKFTTEHTPLIDVSTMKSSLGESEATTDRAAYVYISLPTASGIGNVW